MPELQVDYFVVHGVLGEIGRKRIVIRSDIELAVKALVHAVALRRLDEMVIQQIPVKSSLSCAACGVLVDAQAQCWLLNRFCVGRDGYTAFQRYKGRIYNGEVCDLFECCSRFRLWRRQSWMTGSVLLFGWGRPRGVLIT